MLGDRYGHRPVPSEIPAHEFELLVEEAEGLQLGGVDTLREWYVCDENAVPPEYVLQVSGGAG